MSGLTSLRSYGYPAIAASFGRLDKESVKSVEASTPKKKKKVLTQEKEPQESEIHESSPSEIPSLFSSLSENLPVDKTFTGLPPNKPSSNKGPLSRRRPTSDTTGSQIPNAEARQSKNSSAEYTEYTKHSREFSTLAWKQTLDPRASDAWTKMLGTDTPPALPELVALVESLELVLGDRQLRDLTPAKVLGLLVRRIVAGIKKPDTKKRLTTKETFDSTGMPHVSLGKILYYIGKVATRLPINQETKSALIKLMQTVQAPDVFTLYVLSQEIPDLDINWDLVRVEGTGELFVFLLLVRRCLSTHVRDRNLLRGDKKTIVNDKVILMTKRLQSVIQTFGQTISSGNSEGKKNMTAVQAIQTSDLLLSILMGVMSFQIPQAHLEWVKTCRFLDADRLSCKLILRVYSSSVTLVVNEDSKTEIDEEEIDNEENLLSQIVVADNKLRMAEYTAKLIKKGLEQTWDFEERLELLALAARDNIKHLDLAFKVPSFIEVLNSIKGDLSTVQLRIDQLHKIVNSCWKILGMRRMDILRLVEELHQNSDNKYMFERARVIVRYHEKKHDLISQIDTCFRSMGRSLSRLIGDGELNVATGYRIMFMLLTSPEMNTRAINQLQFVFADSISKGHLSLRDKRKLKLINKYYYASHTGSRKLRDLINLAVENQDQKIIDKAVQYFLKTKEAMLKSDSQK